MKFLLRSVLVGLIAATAACGRSPFRAAAARLLDADGNEVVNVGLIEDSAAPGVRLHVLGWNLPPGRHAMSVRNVYSKTPLVVLPSLEVPEGGTIDVTVTVPEATLGSGSSSLLPSALAPGHNLLVLHEGTEAGPPIAAGALRKFSGRPSQDRRQ